MSQSVEFKLSFVSARNVITFCTCTVHITLRYVTLMCLRTLSQTSLPAWCAVHFSAVIQNMVTVPYSFRCCYNIVNYSIHRFFSCRVILAFYFF